MALEIKSDITFKWYEFELISLEDAENDKKWKEEIASWRDKHLPIVMSVDEGYSFYAIDLTDNMDLLYKDLSLN